MRPPLKIIAAWLVLRKTKLIIWYSIADAATRTVLFIGTRNTSAVTRWAANVALCLHLLGALEVLSGLLFENFPFQTCPAKFLRDIGLPDLDLLTDFTVFLRNRLGLLKRDEARRRIWVWRPRNRRI